MRTARRAHPRRALEAVERGIDLGMGGGKALAAELVGDLLHQCSDRRKGAGDGEEERKHGSGDFLQKRTKGTKRWA
jgi:hypothetical protein